jgi:predicted anti-sigma-YlaC factor YlaD
MSKPHTHLLPDCREVHRLSSEALDRPLSTVERLRMRLHFLACRACRNFHGQMSLLRTAMRRLSRDQPADADLGRK